jgi:hypothetical protein
MGKVKELSTTPVATDVEIKNAYFSWLVEKVQPDDMHWCLLRRLHQKDFIWLESVPHDENREHDGVGLRIEFAEDNEWRTEDVLEILAGPCSCLEMLVALAIRIERDIMYVPDDGDRTGEWFKLMLQNMNLLAMDDTDYYQPFVDQVLDDIMSRHYKRNSKGSIFPVKNTRGKDWRTTEIWMQMMLYFSEQGL